MSDSGKPVIELFVKASFHGSCAITHQWCMTLKYLEEIGLITLRITPMTFDKPPESYTKLDASRVLPVAWVESGQFDDQDASMYVIKSLGHLEGLLSKLNRRFLDASITDEEVKNCENVCDGLSSDFMNFLRNDVAKPLENRLTKLDTFLASNHRYLLRDTVCYQDFQLMPRLQQIRVIGRNYKNFDIPHKLSNVWRYIKVMYETKVFMDTCPSDRDILMRVGDNIRPPKSLRPALVANVILSSIPDAVVEPPSNGDHED